MKIDEFLATLPTEIISGDRVSLPEDVLRRILRFAELKKSDVFYHLGCGDGKSIRLAVREFGVKKAVGIELDKKIASTASIGLTTKRASVLNEDMREADISEATVVLFWSADEHLTRQMEKRFKRDMADGARIITIWAPLGMNLPDKIEFPFFVCKKPFRRAKSVRDQIKAIYGNDCIDFTAAWTLAEKYIDQMESVQPEYRRFLNILQGMIIWVNAWNMGIACENEIPPPVDTYLGILRTFFDIDLSSMINPDPGKPGRTGQSI